VDPFGVVESLTPPAPPDVSVCVPAYNTACWIVRAIESVLSQTHRSLEVVVVDDASTDGTLERVRELDDPRIRLYSNSRNLGHSGNWNRSVSLARGRLIKFLCADDVLYPDCLEAMGALFKAHPSIGLVFSLRDVEMEVPDDPVAVAWQAKHLRAHEVFGDLQEVNSGPALVRTWINSRFALNAVGEPTNVMMSRECLRQVGTFNLRLRQRADMDLWVRAMFFYDIGFVGRPLARYLIRSGSLTNVNQAGSLSWMDDLWLLEGLLSYEEIRGGWTELCALRRRAARRCIRHAVRSAMGGDWSRLAALPDYVGFRLRGRDRGRLYGTLDEQGPPGETRQESTRAFHAGQGDARDHDGET
jgi:glycosyltransferase involved in cell wall biosynthesis